MEKIPRPRRPYADVAGEGKVSISDICSELAGRNIGGVDGTGETAHHGAACSDTADDIQSVSRGGCADADVAIQCGSRIPLSDLEQGTSRTSFQRAVTCTVVTSKIYTAVGVSEFEAAYHGKLLLWHCVPDADIGG